MFKAPASISNNDLIMAKKLAMCLIQKNHDFPQPPGTPTCNVAERKADEASEGDPYVKVA